MERNGWGLRLSTGREISSEMLSLTAEPGGGACEGYDSGLSADYDPTDSEEAEFAGEPAFTPAERQEIAACMIASWREWGARYGAE